MEHLLMDPEPFRLVSLDAGAFDWLWRIVEAKYNLRTNSTPAQVAAGEVAKRAVLAFREAAGTLESPRVTKVLHRRVAKPS